MCLDGFRKVRSDSLDKAEWWIFRHPHFLRGHPHLISEIKRSVHFGNASGSPPYDLRSRTHASVSHRVCSTDNATGGKEVTELKDQVTHLSDRLSSLSAQFERLSMVVSQIQAADPQLLMQQQQQQQQQQEGQSKKRKLSTPVGQSQPVAQIQVPAVKVEGESMPPPSMEAPALTRQASFSAFDFDYFMMLDGTGTPSAALSLKQPTPQGQAKVDMDGNDLEMDTDDNWSVMCLSSDLAASKTPTAATTTVATRSEVATAATVSSSAAANDAGSVQDLVSILGSLTPELKERFVDKLAEVMGTQIANRLADVSQPAASSTNATPAVQATLPNVSTSTTAAFPSSSVAQSSSAVTVSAAQLGALSAPPVQRQQSVVLNDQGEYVLPSGAKAPEIALPLASAAISAYLISALRSVSSTLNQANSTTHSTIPVSSNCF